MKRVTIYWILLMLLIGGISYHYSETTPYNEPHLYRRSGKLFKTIQVGDFFVLKDQENKVEQFFKIVGNPTADSITVAFGNASYNNNFSGANVKEWIIKGIDRPIYYELNLRQLSKKYLRNIQEETASFKVYRLHYPPDQVSWFIRLFYSPLGVFLFVLTIFCLIWLSDLGSLYLSSIIPWVSRIFILGIFSYGFSFLFSWIQYQIYSIYLLNGGYGFPLLLWETSWANALLEFIPVFILFQYLKKHYFKNREFAEEEFAKFISILFLGVTFQLIAVTVIAWVVPKYGLPAINYWDLNQMGYSPLIKKILFNWSLIAIANLLNNFRKYFKQSRRTEKQLVKAKIDTLASQSELDALQARINPHFLYNSLNSIASLAQIDPVKTEEMALALSDFYKHSTNRQDKHWSTVEEEVLLLRRYLDIEKIRFGDRLQYEIIATSEHKDIPIPRFLIQPLVENAIKYGFDKSKNQIVVRIKMSVIKEQLHIQIFDSGQPFSDQLNTGYGLRSVRKKLKLLYPDTHEFYILNKPEKQVHLILDTEQKNNQYA